MTKQPNVNKIIPMECPICSMMTNYIHRLVADDQEADWYLCTCGVIFQKEKPLHGMYDDQYVKKYAEAKNANLVQIHAARTYANLIEEMTYGRKMLDVGFNLPHNMKYFCDRGWITYGLDVNDTLKGSSNIMVGDFEAYDKFKDKYDLIWMSHVLEHFNHPIEALYKAYSLLSEQGVLYISTPDIDFINKTGVAGFPHWKKDEHYILWSERALVRELERIGFNVVLKRKNFTQRYTAWYDVQILAQIKHV